MVKGMKLVSLCALLSCESTHGMRKVRRAHDTDLSDVEGLQTFNTSEVEISMEEDLPTDDAQDAEEMAQGVARGGLCGASIKYKTYEQFLRTHKNMNWVGGCGGRLFDLSMYPAGVVESIEVWHERRFWNALRVKWFNQWSEKEAGKRGGSRNKFTFKRGEKVKGDIRVGTSTFLGGRFSYLKLSTDKGRTFEVGSGTENYYTMFSGNSFLSGFRGGGGSDIDALGIMMWKPIKSVSLIDVLYPKLDVQAKIQSPIEIGSRTYCNPNTYPSPHATVTVTKNVTEGTQACFSLGTSFEFGSSVTVSAGLPVFGVGADATHEWKVGVTANVEMCKNTVVETVITIQYPNWLIPAETSTSYQFTQWGGKLKNIDYTARIKIVTMDNNATYRDFVGTYDAASYSSINHAWTKAKEGVTSC